MILGVGLEMVEITPVEAWLASGDDTFDHVFSTSELSYAEGKRRSAEHLAGRWAAKVAFLKATGLTSAELGALSQVEVIRSPSGKPRFRLAPPVEALLAPRGPWHLHVTLSHSGGLAVALVVFERRGPEATP